MIEKWKKAVDNAKVFGALLTDLSKAFDCLLHDLIIAKLNSYSFNLAALNLIYNYLTKRKQRTKINQFTISMIKVGNKLLRGYTDIFAENGISTEDHTYKELKTLIHNKDAVILKGDKDSSVVIMNTNGYITKIETMIEEGIKNRIYAETDDTTMQDLKRFQEFLRRNFKKYEHYNEMYNKSNEPAKMYGTAKTYKFESTNNIELTKLKFRPIIDQTGTYTYKAAKVISQYLKPLCDSEYTIKNTQSFAKLIKELPPLKEDEEYYFMILNLFSQTSQ